LRPADGATLPRARLRGLAGEGGRAPAGPGRRRRSPAAARPGSRRHRRTRVHSRHRSRLPLGLTIAKVTALMTGQLTVERIVVTPVAFPDPPLLNTVGVHEPYALRTVVEVVTSDGIIGLGETYGDAD